MNKEQAATLKTLRAARRLLARKEGWVKDSETIYRGTPIDPDSRTTGPDSEGKVLRLPYDAYCAWGAIRKADGPGEALAIRWLKQGIRVVMGRPLVKNPEKTPLNSIFKFNDAKRRTKDDVLAAFDAAIELVSDAYPD